MEKYYKVAGLLFKMESYGMTDERAERYRCPPAETVDFEIVSVWPDHKEECPHLSDSVGEYLATGSCFYRNLLDFGGMMLHSSAVVVDGKAYLFSADCGTGKSTHTQLWLKLFGDRAFILNDDKPALRLEDGVWYAYGTPWSGKHDISADLRVPVAGIAMLRRGETNEIEPFGGMEAIHSIFKQVNRPKGPEYRVKLLELLDQLLSTVPVWKLQCNMELEAAKVAYQAMSQPPPRPL